MPEQRLVLFDVDCTLISTNRAGMRSLGKVFEQVTGAPMPAGINPHGMTDPLIVREGFRLAGLSGDLWADLEERIWTLYPAELELEMARQDAARVVHAGVAELLAALAADPRFYLGLLTGNLEVTARIKLEPFNLNRFFPIGAFGSDCGDRCRLGLVALERARRHFARDFVPSQVWVVGDTPRDIQAARAAGARVLAVATGRHSLVELQEFMPDRAVRDLSDLAGLLELLG